ASGRQCGYAIIATLFSELALKLGRQDTHHIPPRLPTFYQQFICQRSLTSLRQIYLRISSVNDAALRHSLASGQLSANWPRIIGGVRPTGCSESLAVDAEPRHFLAQGPSRDIELL